MVRLGAYHSISWTALDMLNLLSMSGTDPGLRIVHTRHAMVVRYDHFQQLPSRTQEQRYLATAWPTNAIRDPRRGAATEMGRGEHATAMRETYRERLVALSHRARSPTAPSASKLDHALGRPHHRRARGFSAASRRTPREAARTMAPRPQAYADGPWAGGHPVGILQRR